MRKLSTEEKNFISELVRISKISYDVFLINVIDRELDNIGLCIDHTKKTIEYCFDESHRKAHDNSFHNIARDFSLKIMGYIKLLKVLEQEGMVFLHHEVIADEELKVGKFTEDNNCIKSELNDVNCTASILEFTQKTIFAHQSLLEFEANDFQTDEDLKRVESGNLFKQNLEVASEALKRSTKTLDYSLKSLEAEREGLNISRENLKLANASFESSAKGLSATVQSLEAEKESLNRSSETLKLANDAFQSSTQSLDLATKTLEAGNKTLKHTRYTLMATILLFILGTAINYQVAFKEQEPVKIDQVQFQQIKHSIQSANTPILSKIDTVNYSLQQMDSLSQGIQLEMNSMNVSIARSKTTVIKQINALEKRLVLVGNSIGELKGKLNETKVIN